MNTGKYVPVPGAKLWTLRQGSGVPFVLCHGGPGLYDYLGQYAWMFSDMAAVLTYDQRGGGRSDKAPPYGVLSFIEDLEGLRRHWGFERRVVGGHSWGANLTMAYGMTHPERCLGLVCICGTGILDYRWHDDYKRMQRERLPSEGQALLDTLERERSTLAGSEWDANAMQRWRLTRKTDFYDFALADNAPSYDEFPVAYDVNVAVGRDMKRLLDAGHWRELAGAVRDIPALFLHGVADPRPYWPSQELAKQMDHARVIVLPEAGHEVFFEQPEAVRREVRAFLAGLES